MFSPGLFRSSLRCRPTLSTLPKRYCLNTLDPAASTSLRMMMSTDHNSRATQQRIDSELRENENVRHSQFLSDAPPKAEWDEKTAVEGTKEEWDRLPEGQGRLSSTSSHLFKLILPLSQVDQRSHKDQDRDAPPTVILLHPSQPLSHVSRLISTSLTSNPAPTDISFRSIVKGQYHQWSHSTDMGDFVRDAAVHAKFNIAFRFKDRPEIALDVRVPTFADRTRYIRRRLDYVHTRLKQMEGLKRACDKEAHRGARGMARTGFGILVLYWGAVARLTFWDYGWDVMEPITYLSGLSTVVCGYLYFLYQGREVSYTSILDHSISSRREQLYRARGLDIEQWVEMVGEEKALKAQIRSIARDYDRDDDAVRKEEEEEKEDEDEKIAEGIDESPEKEHERDLGVVRQRKEREKEENGKKE